MVNPVDTVDKTANYRWIVVETSSRTYVVVFDPCGNA